MYTTCSFLVGRGEINSRVVIGTWRKSWKEFGIAIPPVRIYPWHRIRGTVATARASSSAQVVTYSSSISTDIPLYEPPGVTFDEYLHDRSRIFKAMFPDDRRSKRLNEDELMEDSYATSPVPSPNSQSSCCHENILQITRQRLPSIGPTRHHQPTRAPSCNMITPLFSFFSSLKTEWELQGLDVAYKPTDFSLGVKGLLYPERKGGSGRLKGHLEISISCILPAALALVPDNVLRGVAELVLRRLAEKMKRDVDVGLLTDFRRFRREKLMKNSSAGIGFQPSVPGIIRDV